MDPLPVEPAVLTVRETARYLKLNRNSVYEGIRRGQVPAIRVGRRLLVPKAALDRLLEEGPEKRDLIIENH